MSEVTLFETFTTKELAEQWGCDIHTIFNWARKVLANKRIENGKVTIWTTEEAIIILEAMKQEVSRENKSNLVMALQGGETNPSSSLTGIDTLEVDFQGKVYTVEDIMQETGLAMRTVQLAISELGYSKNGVKTVLSQKQADEVKKHLVGNMAHNTKTYADIDLATKLQADPVMEMAALYARIDEIKTDRIKELEAKVSDLTPKAEYHDRLIDNNHTTNLRDTAKEIGIQEHVFIEALIAKGYLYRDVRGGLRPYADRMEYFSLKDWENNGHTRAQVRVTVKGKALFMQMFEKQGASA